LIDKLSVNYSKKTGRKNVLYAMFVAVGTTVLSQSTRKIAVYVPYNVPPFSVGLCYNLIHHFKIMSKEITSLFEETLKKFRATVAAFSAGVFNKIPFENSWTPAQVADHVLRSQARFPQLLAGNTAEANRSIIEKKESLAKIFLDFTVKLKSPEFILPSTEPLERSMVLKKIDDKWNEIKNAVEANDLNRICIDFELPNMGQLTGIEWCWFQVYHTQRHTRQLENIYQVVGNEGSGE
jgi:hypothetical protein